jgi:alkylation response protein AidB-like acyl-CoA dehydrogenase
VELDAFKAAVDAWLDEHERVLTCDYEGIGTLDQQMAQLGKVMKMAYDAGFMRMGWPERVGGLGGSNLLRAYATWSSPASTPCPRSWPRP